jgi:O-antigen/teichoic acid export membrane protein
MLSLGVRKVIMSNAVETNPQPTRSAGRIIARNTIFGVGAQLALRVANFVFTVLVVRTLGDAHFGQYSIVLAWAGLFSVIGDLGINQYLAREIARDKNKADELFWDTVVLRVILAILASVITVGGAVLLTDYTPEVILGIALFTMTYFFSAVVAPLQSILGGNERLDVLSVMNVLSQIIYMVLAGAFLFMGLGFIWLVIAGVVNMPIIAWLQWRSVKRNQLGPPRFRLNRSLWLGVIRAGLPFAAVQLSLSFAFQVDTIFLSHYTNDVVVGWYSAAYRLTLTILSISRSFNDAILPTLSREHAQDPDSIRPWYYTSVRFIIMFGLPIAVGGSLLSSQFISIYGEDFLPSTLAFAILVWDVPFVIYHSFCGNIATSIKREGAAARIYTSVGVLNVLLNALLVPRVGIAGACFATVLTDFFGAALFYVVLRRELGPGLKFKKLIFVGMAAVVMGVVVYVLRDLNLLLVVLLGAGSYTLLLWLLPSFTDTERQQLIHTASRVTRRFRPMLSRG